MPHLTYDLLVHPFYSLAFAPSTNAGEFEILVRNSLHLRNRWVSRISELKKDPSRGIVIIKPEFEWWRELSAGHYIERAPEMETAMKFFESLKSFAEKSLGKKRVIVVQMVSIDKDSMRDALPAFLAKRLGARGKQGISMGEYYESCVKDGTKAFEQLTGQGLRRSKSLSISKKIPRKAVVRHYTEVLARARRIARIRAKKARL